MRNTALSRIRTIAFFLFILFAVPFLSAAEAQKGQFFRGAERAHIVEETERLAAIQKLHEKDVLSLPGVIGMGVGLDAERRSLVFLIVVDVEAEMPELPKKIEGVAVKVERRPQDIPLDGVPACAQPCHANQLALPVEMGNSGFTNTRCSACTLGFKACKPDTKEVVYVTNAHCSTDVAGCVGGAAVGTGTVHVSPMDAVPQCTLASTIGQVNQHATPSCALGATNTVDATSVTSSAGQTQLSIRDIGVPSAFPGTAVVGDTVQKSGRTTGYTQGTVVSTNFTAVVSGYGCCGTATFVQQIRVDANGPDPFILGGDSGSALLNMDGEIVGLLFSGPSSGSSGNANPIASVLSALNLTLDHTQCIECAATTAAEETPDPEGTLDVLYGVRDRILDKSERGREYIALFYEHSESVVRIMKNRPMLLGETVMLLMEHTPTLAELVSQGTTSFTREEIEEISWLLRAYQKTAEQELDQALEQLDRDLRNEQLLGEFGVYIE